MKQISTIGGSFPRAHNRTLHAYVPPLEIPSIHQIRFRARKTDANITEDNNNEDINKDEDNRTKDNIAEENHQNVSEDNKNRIFSLQFFTLYFDTNVSIVGNSSF